MRMIVSTVLQVCVMCLYMFVSILALSSCIVSSPSFAWSYGLGKFGFCGLHFSFFFFFNFVSGFLQIRQCMPFVSWCAKKCESKDSEFDIFPFHVLHVIIKHCKIGSGLVVSCLCNVNCCMKYLFVLSGCALHITIGFSLSGLQLFFGLLLQDDFAEVSEIDVDRKKSKSLKGLASGHLNGENGKSIAEKSGIRNYDLGSKKSKGSSLDVARKGKVA